MSEKLVDPATKEAVTYKELVAAYKSSYKRRKRELKGSFVSWIVGRREIEDYWETCKPVP